MSNLIDRVGGSIDTVPGASNFSSWTEELSPGEMQIISFLRLLYHHRTPKDEYNIDIQRETCSNDIEDNIKVALLDESTSNISLDVEDLFYSECISRGLTLVSVAHRDSLRKFHKVNLELGLENQHWKLTNLDRSDSV